MNNREILVANTKTQKKYKITTSATTLGELKEAFDNEGIDYSGMTFTEGISKTQLIDNATQLPHDIMYKGQPTNNLVILLTNTKKNIASGAKKVTSEVTMSRKEILEYIKVNHLQDEVMRLFGNNATRVSTANLLTLIKDESVEDEEEGDAEVETPKEEDFDDTDYDNDYDEVENEKEEEEEEEESNDDILTVDDIIADADVRSLEDSLFLHIAMLVQAKALDSEDIKSMIGDLNMLLGSMDAEKFFNLKESFKKPTKTSNKVTSSDGSITEDDIDNMLDDLGM